jgi:hypothetical protein
MIRQATQGFSSDIAYSRSPAASESPSVVSVEMSVPSTTDAAL